MESPMRMTTASMCTIRSRKTPMKMASGIHATAMWFCCLYRVIARTDIFNQVYEDVNEANNRTASADTLSVAVDELQIGVPLATQLSSGQQRMYRITVPADQTLRVTLRAADDQSANEIFVRHDAVPTSAAFDATYEGPLGSDLSALVPSTEPGTYYLLVRNFSAPPEGTDITLLAELLPLAITSVRRPVSSGCDSEAGAARYRRVRTDGLAGGGQQQDHCHLRFYRCAPRPL